MRQKRRLLGLLAGLFILFLIAPIAQAGRYEIGGGVGVAPDYEGSDDYELVPLPTGGAYFDNGLYIEVLGLNARANLMPSSWISWLKIGPVYNYRPQRSDVDNGQVDDMRNVSDANEMGGFFKIVANNLYVNFEYLLDIGDAHEGEWAELSTGYKWLFSEAWTFNFGVFGSWADNDYHETYFSVSNRDSRKSGLKPYDADGGVKDLGLNLGANWRFANHWNLRAVAQLKHMVGDANDDSPVVQEGSEIGAFGGLMIVFSF